MNRNSYRDASTGMRHLFTAEILNIISVVFLFITAVLAMTSLGVSLSMGGSVQEVTFVSGIRTIAIIFGVIWITFVLISFIIENSRT